MHAYVCVCMYVCVCVDERLGPEDNRLSQFADEMLPVLIHRHDEHVSFGDLSEAALYSQSVYSHVLHVLTEPDTDRSPTELHHTLESLLSVQKLCCG